MPLITVQTIENVLTPEQKKQLITKITDVIVAVEGEAARGLTWVKIEEVREGHWGVGGQPVYARDLLRMQKGRLNHGVRKKDHAHPPHRHPR